MILSLLLTLVFAASITLAKTNLAIVQLFEWNWNSVANECQSLANIGYSYAQVSPPQEHITGTQWWTDYQPVSYKLISKRGNRDQFIKMVQTCSNVGIGIIVDAVLNHMSAGQGTGVGGSSYTKYNYPAVPYVDSDFHTCRRPINDWNNEDQVWNCELVSLSDLATGTQKVQSAEAAYLQDLVNVGVVGFRFDAAKSIPPDDLHSIISKVNVPAGRDPLLVIQEVEFGESQPITPQMYTENGNVIEFRTAFTLHQYFQSGISSLLSQIPGNGWEPATSAISFVMNHDLERNPNSAITSTSANNAYVLANIYLLAQPYSVPTVFSGYNFNGNFDQGAPQSFSGLTDDVTCYSNNWRCEHKWNAIAAMVKFYNAARVPTFIPASQFSTGNSQQLSFGRGKIGHVLINNQGGNWQQGFQTTLADGNYCDIIHNPCSNSSGNNIRVQGGYFNANVPAFDAVVLMAA